MPETTTTQTIVVKVGSGVVAPQASLDLARLKAIATPIAQQSRDGARIAVVSSGAVACGLGVMGLSRIPSTIADRQVAAAIGQSRLVEAWSAAFSPSEIRTAQVLLTQDDLDHRTRYLNARRTLDALLARGIVPIINENDSVSFAEIRLGDNDRLSAQVAVAVDAHRLVLLSVVPGLLDERGEVIPRITDIAEAARLVRTDRSETGLGGMATKLEAADIAARHGIETTIADGTSPDAIRAAVRGERVGTRLCIASPGAHTARKSWIAYSTRSRGRLIVDEGAARAITERGASLLPRGVVAVEGEFEAGAPVDIARAGGETVARGLCSYAASEARRLVGAPSSEIEARLGYRYLDELVHRDDLVVLVNPSPAGQ